jgi:hypothetical protein
MNGEEHSLSIHYFEIVFFFSNFVNRSCDDLGISRRSSHVDTKSYIIGYMTIVKLKTMEKMLDQWFIYFGTKKIHN